MQQGMAVQQQTERGRLSLCVRYVFRSDDLHLPRDEKKSTPVPLVEYRNYRVNNRSSDYDWLENDGGSDPLWVLWVRDK